MTPTVTPATMAPTIEQLKGLRRRAASALAEAERNRDQWQLQANNFEARAVQHRQTIASYDRAIKILEQISLP